MLYSAKLLVLLVVIWHVKSLRNIIKKQDVMHFIDETT